MASAYSFSRDWEYVQSTTDAVTLSSKTDNDYRQADFNL